MLVKRFLASLLVVMLVAGADGTMVAAGQRVSADQAPSASFFDAAAASAASKGRCHPSDGSVHADCLRARKLLRVAFNPPIYAAALSGMVWASARGGRFSDELPVEGLDFHLYSQIDGDPTHEKLATSTTAPDGSFSFDTPSAGCYVVKAKAPNGARFNRKDKSWSHEFCLLPPEFCAGQLVTVYLEEGDEPTEGNDVIFGTDHDDDIAASGGSDTICTREGNDVVRLGPSGSRVLAGPGDDQVFGGDGDDAISGGPGADALRGGGGSDTISGDEGNDEIAGGPGNDLLYGNEGEDQVYGDGGNDIVFGGPGNDRLGGGDDADLLTGEAGNDAMAGGPGNDTLNGGTGTDTLAGDGGDDELIAGPGGGSIEGGDGDDTVEGGPDADRIEGGEGSDTISGGRGDDQLFGGSESAGEAAGDDAIDGGEGADRIFGQAGDDDLSGGPGDDAIDGGDGDDRLVGGEGANVMTGGPGADLFVEPRGSFTVEAGDRVERNYTDSALGGFPETCRVEGFAVPGVGILDCEIPWFLFQHTSAELSYEWGLDVFFHCRPDGVIISDRCFSPPAGVARFLDGTQPHHGYFRDAYRAYRSWSLRRPFTIEPYRNLDEWPEATTIGAIFSADDRFRSRSVIPGVIEYGRNPDLSRGAVYRDLFKQFAFSYLTGDLNVDASASLDSLAAWAADQAAGIDNRCTSTATAGCTPEEALNGEGRLLWEYMLDRKGNHSFVSTYLIFLNTREQPVAAAEAVLGSGWEAAFTTWANQRVSAGGLGCPAPCVVVEPSITRSWAYVVGGPITQGTAGRAVVRSLGGQLVAGLAAEALVQYFQTFDLDARINQTMAAHLFPMLADIPGDDLRITVSEYDFVPWIQPEIRPYEDDPSDCLRWAPALGPGMRAFIDRRTTNPNISRTATLAVALYCIDNKMGAAASRSGGTGNFVPDMPGLAFDPGTPETLAAFGEPFTPNHAETNLLASLIEGVPIRPTSVGIIFMLVDNPQDGRICGRCLDDRLDAFQRRYPGVRLTVIAENNAYQDGLVLQDTDPARYQELLNG